MPFFDFRSVIRNNLKLSCAAALVLLCLGFLASGAGAGPPIPAAAGEGPWINAVNLAECSQENAGTVCAEWPVRDQGMAYVCCIDADAVGTFQSMEMCEKPLGIRAF